MKGTIRKNQQTKLIAGSAKDLYSPVLFLTKMKNFMVIPISTIPVSSRPTTT